MADGVFKIAIIGAGGISGAHSSAAKASAGRVQIVAVVDPNEAARTKLSAEHGAQAFSDISSLVKAIGAGLEVGGVVVCTPPSIRVKIIQACFKAKLPILMEKPIASTIAEARKLAGLAAKNKKVPAFVAYCHRFTPAVNAMIDHLASGKIGRLVRFENAFACDLPGHETKWFSDAKVAGGGAYLDMGSHSLDLLHYVAGPAKTVGAIFDHKWKKRTETAATVLTKSTKKLNVNTLPGVAGVIISGWAETSRFTVAILGDKGMLSYDYEKPTELVFKDLVGKTDLMQIESHDVRFTKQLLAFADAVQNKAKTRLATFADGLAVAAMNDAAARAAKKK